MDHTKLFNKLLVSNFSDLKKASLSANILLS